jgi:hypothetical protein
MEPSGSTKNLWHEDGGNIPLEFKKQRLLTSKENYFSEKITNHLQQGHDPCTNSKAPTIWAMSWRNNIEIP